MSGLSREGLKNLPHLSLNNAVLYFSDAILNKLVFIVSKYILTGDVVCLFD